MAPNRYCDICGILLDDPEDDVFDDGLCEECLDEERQLEKELDERT